LAIIAALGGLVVGNDPASGLIPGVLIGSRISVRVPESVLRFGIAVMLIVSGIWLFGA
jgi:uncharacterized membrane protein YfcA